MNKKEFLNQLRKNLKLLDDVERQEIINFYEERFSRGLVYENKSEQEVAMELESPDTIAKNVLEQYGINTSQINQDNDETRGIYPWNIVGLIVFDILMSSWIFPTLIAVSIALFGSFLSYFAVLAGVVVTYNFSEAIIVFTFTSGVYLFLLFIAINFTEFAIYIMKKICIWHIDVISLSKGKKLRSSLNKLSLKKYLKRNRFFRVLNDYALGLSIIAIIIGSILIFSYKKDLFYQDSDLLTDEKSYDLTSEIQNNDIWTINTDTGVLDVMILKTNGQELKITHSYYEENEFDLSVSLEDNEISIKNRKKHRIFNFNLFFLFSENPSVIIEIPDDINIDGIVIDSGSGDILIDKSNIKDINIDITNGRVKIEDLHMVDSIQIDNANGGITLSNIDSAFVDAKITNGDISLNNSNVINGKFKTTNGYIEIENVNVSLQNGETLICNTVNGYVDLENVYTADVILKTTNGYTKYFNDDLTYILDSLVTNAVNGSSSHNVPVSSN